jgi:hypothetical protein
MIVGKNDSRAAMRRGGGDDFTDREDGACFVAFVTRQVEAVRRVINMRDPQRLATGVLLRETTGEKFASGRKAIKLQREFGTLIPHAVTVLSIASEDAPNEVRNTG